MCNKILFSIILYLSLLNILFANNLSDNKYLDHKIFIENLKNSQGQIYKNIINEYNFYLSKNPKDVRVIIELCKFVQNAMYNSEEESNPNQDYLDSCTTVLFKSYPDNPEVLVYKSSLEWGDEKKVTLQAAMNSITFQKENWTDENIGIIYYETAMQYYSESNYLESFNYMTKAYQSDIKYKTSLEFVRILINLKKQDEALVALHDNSDTITSPEHLSQKAELLLELKDYKMALEIYKRISTKDSSLINNNKLATTMEGMGEFKIAREYLVSDTIGNWNRKTTRLNLFLHDFKYQNADSALNSYNSFRDLGYSVDPLAIYRLKLFFKYLFLPWKWHDILGLLTFILLIILIIIFPSVWILPVYFIGHKWEIVYKNSSETFIWGLKSFWFISSGYLCANFAPMFVNPEYFNFTGILTNYQTVINEKELGLIYLVFILVLSVFSFLILYNTKLNLVLPRIQKYSNLIFTTIGIFIVYKIFTLIYIKIGINVFGVKFDDLVAIQTPILATREDIKALLFNYGGFSVFLIISILVPFYEELIFRGVILESCKRYIYFGWANILQASLFSLAHMDLFLFPVYLCFGIIVSILNKRFGGLYSGILFHAINNGLAILVLISIS